MLIASSLSDRPDVVVCLTIGLATLLLWATALWPRQIAMKGREPLDARTRPVAYRRYMTGMIVVSGVFLAAAAILWLYR